MRFWRGIRPRALALLALGLGACGGGDSGSGPGTDLQIAQAASSGDGQSGPAGQALAAPLRVVVTRNGSPESGAAVTWSVVSGGGTLAPGGPTDANGVATAQWTLGGTAGAQSARASLAGAAGSPVGFAATALAGGAAGLSAISGNGQTAAPGAALPAPLVVGVRDATGNPVAGVTVQWTVTAGGGAVDPTSGATNAQGQASTQWTLGPNAGGNTVQASASGGSGPLPGSPVSFSATGVTAAPPPLHATVAVKNNFFMPQVVTIAAGGTVTWEWDGVDHNVTPVLSPTFPGPSATANAPFTYGPITFANPGTYQYICTIHGAVSGGQPTGMRGTVIVQ